MDPQPKKREYRYSELLSTDKLEFLEYYMLPENDEFEYVYRPGDDSFLMLSVLKLEISTFPPKPIIIEIGSGSGILSSHVNSWLNINNNQSSVHISTDINMDACLFSQKYYSQYELQIQQVCASLLKSINIAVSHIKNGPIVIIFNPPYVPTTEEQFQNQHKYLVKKIDNVVSGNLRRENDCNMIAYSYMGGPDGLKTTKRFLEQIWDKFSRVNIDNLQTEKELCRVYFIVMEEQGIEKVEKFVEEMKNERIRTSLVFLQHYNKFNEQLYVLMISLIKIS